MLVLTRRVEQKVYVGDEIAVQILAIRGGAVSIGIAAPPRVVILREEIIEAVRQENRRAALAGWQELEDVEALLGRRR